MKRVILIAVTALCILALLVGCGGSTGIYKAGTYTATAAGYGGDVMVEVEFDKEAILSVKVISQNETLGFGDKAIEALPERIVESQAWEVDAVSSATMTSEAIKAAVKDCVEQAKSR